MQRMALGQLDGGLSRRLLSLRDDLIGLEALIAYDVDFPEEDDGPIPRMRIDQAVGGIASSLDALLSTAPAGEVIRDGAVVVIAVRRTSENLLCSMRFWAGPGRL